MTVETTLRLLAQRLDDLHDAVRTTQLTVREDQPAGPAPHLVDALDEVVTEVAATLEEAGRAVAGALDASCVGGRRAWPALARAHEHSLHVAVLLHDQLLGADRQSDLRRCGREGGPGWEAWAGTVHHGLSACVAPSRLVDEALLGCWQALAERADRHDVAVHASRAIPIMHVGSGTSEVLGPSRREE